MPLLTGSANCIKYTLFAFNLVFLITGIILIAVGVTVATVFHQYELFLTDNFFSIPTFLIVIGAFIFIISFVGCWGAIKEQYCLILIFSILLGIIFIFELSAGISGYVLRGDAEELIKGTLQETIKNYNKDNYDATTTLWDFVQRDFSCCGVDNYSDWEKVTSTQELPLSCCDIPDGAVGPFSCTTSETDKNRHLDGCLAGFTNFIGAHAVSLGAAGIVIAVIQFFGVIFACYIAREVKIRNGVSGFIS